MQDDRLHESAEIVTKPKRKLEDYEYGRILSMSMEAGQILLQNGAEISRVEDTMTRLARAYYAEDCDFFVLSNGIFTTGTKTDGGTWKSFAKVQHIPVRGTQLDRVGAVNQLSRDVVKYHYTLDQTEARLEEIRNMPAKPAWAQILASGIGAGAFAIIFGGTLWDAFAALIVGLILWVFVLKVSGPYLGKIVGNIAGGFLVSMLCMTLRRMGIGDSLDHVIIGGVIPLVPGVAFTNGIRDIAEGDYISGSVRLLDALLVFMCIAVGCGVHYQLDAICGGVMPL